MKKFLIISSSVVFIAIISLLLLPLFLRGTINNIIKEQANRHFNKDVHIPYLHLNMFQNFPDLTISVKDVCILEKDHLLSDTLIYIPVLRASVNLPSLLDNKEVIVKHLLISNGRIKSAASLQTSRNNVIQTPKSSKTEKKKKKVSDVQLNEIHIENLSIDYQDKTNQLYLSIPTLNLSGNVSKKQNLLKTDLAAQNIYFKQGNITWLNNTDLHWEGKVATDWKDLCFDIQENNVLINDLKLILSGKIYPEKDKCLLNLHLQSQDNRFENFLDILPKEYQPHFQKLQTTGEFSMEAATQGYYYPGHLPSFSLQLNINNASIKYPDLPEAINQINVNLNIKNPGGPVDSTQIEVKQFNFNIAENPFALSLQINNPKDPDIQGSAKGTLNFAHLQKVIPYKEFLLEGNLYTHLFYSGKYVDIENKEYEKFKANGEIQLYQVQAKSKDNLWNISIPAADVSVTPATLEIKKLKAHINSSNISLQGYVSNYLPYLLKNKTLEGKFMLNSPFINLNEFKKKTASSTHTTSPANSPFSKKLHLQFQTNIQKLLLDRMTISHIQGTFKFIDTTTVFNDITMDLLHGTMKINGTYTPSHLNIALHTSNLDIPSAYQSFQFMQQQLPVAKTCEGQLSGSCTFDTHFTPEGTIDIKKTNGSGNITTSDILIRKNSTLQKLATTLKNNELDNLSISALKIEFEMKNGNLMIKPFTSQIAGNTATFQGYQTADGNMDYLLNLNVKRDYFGKDINNLLKSIPGSRNIKNLDIDIKIEGTLAQPEIKTDLSKAIKTVRKEAEKELKNKLNKLFR